MRPWGRWGGALLALGMVAALTGCGQLFSQGGQPVTLTELSNRVDSLDAQVGELQAALANLGGGSAQTQTKTGSSLQPGLPVAVVEADVLNVRSEPSLSGTVVGTLLQNTQVNVLAENGNWTEIRYTNPSTQVSLTGWVDSDYLGPATGTATGATGGSAAGAGGSAAPTSGATTAAATGASAASGASGIASGIGSASGAY